MKKIILGALLLLQFSSFAQFQEIFPQPSRSTNHPASQQFLTAYNAGNTQQAVNIALELVQRYPDEDLPYINVANALYSNKMYDRAVAYFYAATMMDPFKLATLQNAISVAAYTKKPELTSGLMTIASFIPTDANSRVAFEGAIQRIITDFTPYAGYEQVVANMQRSLTWFKQNYANSQILHQPNYDKLYNLDYAATKNSSAAPLYASLMELKVRVDKGEFPKPSYYYLLGSLSLATIKNDPAVFQKLLPELNAALADKSTSPLAKFFLYKQMINHYTSMKKFEAIITASGILLAETVNNEITRPLYLEALVNMTDALLQEKKLNQAAEYAAVLSKSLSQIKHQETKIKAYNAAATALSYTDKTLAKQFYDEGISYVVNSGWANKYQTLLTQNRDTHLGIKGNTTIAAAADSPTGLYNAGMQQLQTQNFAGAIPHFVKAKRILEVEIKQANKEKVQGLLAEYSRVCSQLIGCLAETKTAAEVLEVIEDSKGFSLAEATAKSKLRAKQSAIQAALKPDEALLYYTDISGEVDDGFYIVVLLTKEKISQGFAFAHRSFLPMVYAGFNTEIGDIEFALAKREFRSPNYTRYSSREQGNGKVLKQGEMGLLVELYRRKLIEKPNLAGTNATNGNIAKGIGMAFYDLLIKMFEPEIAQKKHLIFSLDGELNYLPFETLMNAKQEYLIQKYDISYVSSGTTLVNLRSRKPVQHTKALLAFGDAKYSARAATGFPLKSQADVERVKLKVDEAITKNQNLDQAFATFSKTAANYLLGTKKEVEMIKSIVPDADLFMDKKMTENEFKGLNKNGTLNQYRIIHLASHAGVHPYVFDLSGIMFSTFPTPQNGEDGELVVSEVAKLKMQPDLVMLSACQTGLGKLVPGDGVAGLNQAFLEAGANATITSLWNVNDYATSVLVSKFYQKVFKEKKGYVIALNEVKRDMMNSADSLLQAPSSWAPFIYTGK